MKVFRFDLSRLRNEEWFQFYTEFKTQVEAHGAKKLSIDALFAVFLTLYKEADVLLEILRKSAYTKQIVDADFDRDQAFRGLINIAKALRNRQNDEKSLLAEQLYNKLNTYRRSVLSRSYSEESGAIFNLLQDLNGNYKNHVTKLGLLDWVTELTNSEDKFLELRQKRYDESSEKPKAKLTIVRSSIDRYYINMMNILDAHLLALGFVDDGDDNSGGSGGGGNGGGGGGDYERAAANKNSDDLIYKFALIWNEHIRKFSNMIAQRRGRNLKKEEAENYIEKEDSEDDDNSTD